MLASGEVHARISSYQWSVAEFGYDPIVAIQIALADRAVDTVNQH